LRKITSLLRKMTIKLPKGLRHPVCIPSHPQRRRLRIPLLISLSHHNHPNLNTDFHETPFSLAHTYTHTHTNALPLSLAHTYTLTHIHNPAPTHAARLRSILARKAPVEHIFPLSVFLRPWATSSTAHHDSCEYYRRVKGGVTQYVVISFPRERGSVRMRVSAGW